MNFKKILPIIGIILFLIIIFTLDFDKLIEVVSSVNPFYGFLCFFAFIPLVLIANIQWQILLRKQKIKVSYFYTIKNFFIGYFYGFISPGGIGGFTKALYLHEETDVPLPKCFSNVVICNTIDYIALLILGAIGAIYFSSRFPFLFYTVIVVMCFVLFLFLFFFKHKKSKLVFTRIVKSRIFASVKDKVEDSIDSFYEDLPRFKDVILPFSISISSWVLKYIILFYIAKLFLIEIPIIDFIMILAVADTVASMPISIYGLGTREATLISLFSIFAITNEQIVSASLFWFVILWFVPSIIGLFVTLHESKKLYKFKLTKESVSQFEEYMKKYPELYDNLADIVKKNISKNAKKPVVVDLGVGPGLLSKAMKDVIPNADIIGVDPSEFMLECAKKNVDIKTMSGNCEKIPLKDNSVDIVVTRFTLTYWPNPKKGFTEIRRVLKPGGKLVIEALNKDFSQFRLLLIKIHMIMKKSGADIAGYHIDAYKTAYSLDQVEQFISDSKLKMIKKELKKNDWKFLVVAEKR